MLLFLEICLFLEEEFVFVFRLVVFVLLKVDKVEFLLNLFDKDLIYFVLLFLRVFLFWVNLKVLVFVDDFFRFFLVFI